MKIKFVLLSLLIFMTASVCASEKDGLKKCFLMSVSDHFEELANAINEKNAKKSAIAMGKCVKAGDDLSYLYLVTVAELHEKRQKLDNTNSYQLTEVRSLSAIVGLFEDFGYCPDKT